MGSEQNDGTSYSPAEPKLCVNGCGFFGSASNMNLCSKCYRDLRIEEEQAASAKAAMKKTLNLGTKQQELLVGEKPVAAQSGVSLDSSSSSSADVAESAAVLVQGNDKADAKAANRCLSCNKKVGFTGFKCKCGSTFCGSHRYPENHDCSFDFKESGRNAIAKANPVIKADKVERI